MHPTPGFNQFPPTPSIPGVPSGGCVVGILRGLKMREVRNIEVTWHRVYQSEFQHQVGFYLVACWDLCDVFQRFITLAVVDDFGNLVGVS